VGPVKIALLYLLVGKPLDDGLPFDRGLPVSAG